MQVVLRFRMPVQALGVAFDLRKPQVAGHLAARAGQDGRPAEVHVPADPFVVQETAVAVVGVADDGPLVRVHVPVDAVGRVRGEQPAAATPIGIDVVVPALDRPLVPLAGIRIVRILQRHAELALHRRGVDEVVPLRSVVLDDAQVRLVPLEAVLGHGVRAGVQQLVAGVVLGVLLEHRIPRLEQLLLGVVQAGSDRQRVARMLGRHLRNPAEHPHVVDDVIVDQELRSGADLRHSIPVLHHHPPWSEPF